MLRDVNLALNTHIRKEGRTQNCDPDFYLKCKLTQNVYIKEGKKYNRKRNQ